MHHIPSASPVRVVRRGSGRLAAGLLAVTLAASTALGQMGATSAPSAVLDEVPSGALLVLKINHLQDTSKKLADMLQALGVTDFVPELSDPLAAVQSQTNMISGIDKSGDAAVALLDGDFNHMGPEHPENKPPLLLLVPVTDYKAFLNNLDVNKTEEGITMARPKTPDRGDDYIYAVQWGNYAVLSPKRELLTAKPDGLKPTGLAARELTDKDATLFVNIPQVKSKLLPVLEANRSKIIAELQKRMNGAAPATDSTTPAPESASPQTADANRMPLVRSAVNQGITALEEGLQSEQAQTLGFSVSKAGINGTFLTEFMADSYWGKLVQQAKASEKSLLSGLPAVKYLAYGGFSNDPKTAGDAFDHLVGPFRKEVGDSGDQGKAIAAALDNYRDQITTVTRSSFGWVAPTTPVGQGGLLQTVGVCKSDDANKLLDLQSKAADLQHGLMQSMGLPSAQQTVTKVTPNARTVDGIGFTQFNTQLNTGTDTPAAMQAQQFMMFAYGPNGITVNEGIVDPQTLLQTVGGDDTFMSGAIAAAKKDDDVLGPTDPLKLVDAQLPKSRTGEVYLPLDAIVSTAVTYAGQFGFAMPLQLPPNLPPIGITFGNEGSAARVDEFIPTPLVQSLVQAGMQVYMQMHGGGGGAPPAGGAGNGAGGGL